MFGDMVMEKEMLDRLDKIIEQNNTIIQQDFFRAKHIANIKRDIRIIETLIALEFFGAIILYFMLQNY